MCLLITNQRLPVIWRISTVTQNQLFLVSDMTAMQFTKKQLISITLKMPAGSSMFAPDFLLSVLVITSQEIGC